MQHMLMCCFEEKMWMRLPDGEKDRIMREYGALMRDLTESGQMRGGGQLRSTSSATTLRMKNGKAVLTDGPFAETKEQLGGYHLLECRNLDEALSISAQIQTLPAGSAIEVRPFEPIHVNEFSASG